MSAERILILGANGFLGSNLVLSAPGELHVTTQTRRAVEELGQAQQFVSELTDRTSLEHLLDSAAPTTVVNCAALADVDRCEREPAFADLLNRALPAALADTCHKRGIRLIHISTDAVFGETRGPLHPYDPVSPINEYGRSKAAGESAVLERDPLAVIARTNIFGWSPTGNRSLLEFFHARLSRRIPTPGFTDVYFRPISVFDVWPALLAWKAGIQRSGKGGIRHATGNELLSKYDFGVRVAARFGYDPDLVKPTSISDAGLRASRSQILDVVPSVSDGLHAAGWVPTSLDESLDLLRAAENTGLQKRLASFVSPQEGARA